MSQNKCSCFHLYVHNKIPPSNFVFKSKIITRQTIILKFFFKHACQKNHCKFQTFQIPGNVPVIHCRIIYRHLEICLYFSLGFSYALMKEPSKNLTLSLIQFSIPEQETWFIRISNLVPTCLFWKCLRIFILGAQDIFCHFFLKNQENSYEYLEDLFLEPQFLGNHFNPSRSMEANVKLICFGIVF